MLTSAFPDGAVSVVADSYDVWNFVDNFIGGEELIGAVRARRGTVVVRPDSGDPVEMVLAVLSRLESKFGAERNEAGYKLLPPYVRVIQVI